MSRHPLLIMHLILGVATDIESRATADEPKLNWRGESIEYWRAKITERSVSSSWVRKTPLLTETDPKALPILREFLKDDQAIVRCYALFCIANLGEKARDTVPEITRALDDSAWYQVRIAALVALDAVCADKDAVRKAAVKLLADDDPYVRLSAIAVGAGCSSSNEVFLKELIGIIKKNSPVDWDSRMYAIELLGKFDYKDERVSTLLYQLVTDPADKTGVFKSIAAEILGQSGDKSDRVLAALKSLFVHKWEAARLQSACSYWQLTKSSAEVLPLLLELCDGETIRLPFERLIVTLREIGSQDKRAVDGLVTIFANAKYDNVRNAAREALGKVAPDKLREVEAKRKQ